MKRAVSPWKPRRNPDYQTMSCYIDLIPLIQRLTRSCELNQVKLEKRRKTYGVHNYGEITNLLNPSDGDCWDVFVPGMNTVLDVEDVYAIEKVYGVVLTPNGNHKIAVGLKGQAVAKEDAQRDIDAFTTEYATAHKFVCKWLEIDSLQTEEVREKCKTLQRMFSAFRNNGRWEHRRKKIFS